MLERYLPVEQVEGPRVGILDTEAWMIAAFSVNADRRDSVLCELRTGERERNSFYWFSVHEQSLDIRGGGWAWKDGGRLIDVALHVGDTWFEPPGKRGISKHSFMIGEL